MNRFLASTIFAAPLLLLGCGESDDGESCGPTSANYDFSAGSTDFDGNAAASLRERSFTISGQSFAATGGAASHVYTRAMTCGGDFELLVNFPAGQGRDSVTTTVALNGVEQNVAVAEESGQWTTRLSGRMFDGISIEIDVSSRSLECVDYSIQYAEICIEEECEDESCGRCDGGLDYDHDGHRGCDDADCMIGGVCDLDCADPNEPNETEETATALLFGGAGSETITAVLSNVAGEAETDYFTVVLCDSGSITWSLRHPERQNDFPVGFRSQAGDDVRQGTTRPVSQGVWGIDETIEFDGAEGTVSTFRFGAGDTRTERACVEYEITAEMVCD